MQVKLTLTRSSVLRLAVALTVIVVLATTVITVSPAMAAGEVFQLDSVNSFGCSSTSFHVSWSGFKVGETYAMITTATVAGGLYMDQHFAWDVPSSSGTGGWAIFDTGGTATWPMPAGQPVTITVKVQRPAGTTHYTYRVVLDGCDTGNIISADGWAASGPSEEPYTGIYLLSSVEQAPYLSIPNANGATPCGVFDVNGWGAKYVGMGDFPGCTAPVTVMCLTDQGAWTADTVSGVVMHGDWEVDFTSSQHGVCGLFEQ